MLPNGALKEKSFRLPQSSHTQEVMFDGMPLSKSKPEDSVMYLPPQRLQGVLLMMMNSLSMYFMISLTFIIKVYLRFRP